MKKYKKSEKTEAIPENKTHIAVPEAYVKLFYKDGFSVLSAQYTRFQSLRNKWGKTKDEEGLFIKWLGHRRIWIEEELLSGRGEKNVISNVNDLHRAPQEQILFQNFDYFKFAKNLWQPRFESKLFRLALFLNNLKYR